MSDKPLIDQDSKPVPYEFGGDCIFYAIQSASMFFNNQPLTIKDREECRELHGRTIDLANRFVDKKDDLFTVSILAALRNISTKLKTMGILISSISSTEEILQRVKKDNFVKREKINTITVNEGDIIGEVFPILVFSHGRIGFHVWCPTSKEEFSNDHWKNVAMNGIVLTAQLKKG